MARARLGRSLLWIALALLLALTLASLALWTQRKSIARDAIARELARRGVPATYRLAAIGPRTQRLEGLRVGDATHPDLSAESATVTLGWSLTGPRVRAIAARGVRLAATLGRDGRISLGAIDRLLPPPSDAPFALPDLDLALEDAEVRLATPAGPVALALLGSGDLHGGFRGHVALAAPRLAWRGCEVVSVAGSLNLSIDDRRPRIDGPLRAEVAGCAEARARVNAPRVALDARFAPALDGWRGTATVAAARLVQGPRRALDLRARVSFAGDARRSMGSLAFTTAAAAVPEGGARSIAFEGSYAIAPRGVSRLAGRARLVAARLGPGLLPTLRGSGAGTPAGPLLDALDDAMACAARRFDARGEVAVALDGAAGSAMLRSLEAESASGGRIALGGGAGLGVAWHGDRRALRLDTRLNAGGGGLPSLRLALRQPVAGAPLSGEGSADPFAAGGARIRLAPLRLVPEGRETRLVTGITLDGPLADGAVTGLSVPIAARLGRGGALAIGERCVAVGFQALRLSGARFGPTRLPLCPIGPAFLLRGADGATAGGARISAPRLTGQVGAAPLAIAARAVALRLAPLRLDVDAMAVRLGEGEGQTRLDVADLVGSAGREGFGGRFAGAAGRIGRVPVIASDGAGSWSLARAVLSLAGALRVADTAAAPRFNPLVSRDMRLSLRGGVVRVSGTLAEPHTARAVTRVTLVHDLAAGGGHALLDVPRLDFDETLQPEMLTRLTLGVVAEVRGSVTGSGRIAWDARGVTSEGRFRTSDMALAAAFGPVAGIRGEIGFSDLLGLVTPPGQVLEIGEVNPGIPVFDGRLRYRLLPDTRVRVEGARWPLSGGALVLEPTTLDFGRPSERRLSFRVEGLDAAQFIEQFKLDNIAATGTFDGVLPMLFDARGGRIVGGRLQARPPGGRVSYVGEVSNAKLGTYGQLAFDALKSIRYQTLRIDLDGALDGEVVSRIGFTGINEQAGKAAPARGLARNFLGLPFRFIIVVRAPFRGLLNSAAGFADPSTLLKRDGVQPQESGDVPPKP